MPNYSTVKNFLLEKIANITVNDKTTVFKQVACCKAKNLKYHLSDCLYSEMRNYSMQYNFVEFDSCQKITKQKITIIAVKDETTLFKQVACGKARFLN